jgi:hypothetical protein
MSKIILSIFIIFLIHPAFTYTGVDVSQLFPTSAYQCMKNDGYSFAVIRGYHSYGGIDTNAVQGLKNAKAAGLVTDVYMFPCRGKNATSQVIDMMNQIPSDLYGMPWLDI